MILGRSVCGLNYTDDACGNNINRLLYTLISLSGLGCADSILLFADAPTNGEHYRTANDAHQIDYLVGRHVHHRLVVYLVRQKKNEDFYTRNK